MTDDSAKEVEDIIEHQRQSAREISKIASNHVSKEVEDMMERQRQRAREISKITRNNLQCRAEIPIMDMRVYAQLPRVRP